MINKNMVISLMLVVFGFNAQANNSRDELGRTQLMNYVISQEVNKKNIDQKINRLWNVCYETDRIFDGVYQDFKGRIHNKYKYKTKRRAECTDQDIQNLKQSEFEKEQWLFITLNGVNYLVDSGELLNMKDYSGNTVLNFCYTYEIYDRLRCLGAEFQPLLWVYFNPGKTIAGLVTVGYAALGTMIVVSTQQ